MCFYKSKTKGFTRVKIAEKNIVCYKVCNRKKKNTIKSIYRDFLYTQGKTYEVEKFGGFWYDVRLINVGLHSYSTFEEAVNYREGSRDERVCKFIIPKGTKYYENPDRLEYVSLRIKFVEVLVLKTYKEDVKRKNHTRQK
jgi:hypothetical protein